MKRDPDFTENFRNGHAACWSWASRQQRVVRRASRRVVVFLSRHCPAGSRELCAEFQEGFSSCCRQEGCCIRSMMSTSLQLLHAVVCCVVSCIQTQLGCTLLRANDQNAAWPLRKFCKIRIALHHWDSSNTHSWWRDFTYPF